MQPLQMISKAINNPEKILPYIRTKADPVFGLPVTSYYDYSQTNVFERDWDVLLILDACRIDSIEATAKEYDFIPQQVQSITSVGHGSPQWMANTFTSKWSKEMKETIYISANPHTERVLGGSLEGVHAKKGGSEDRLSDFKKVVPLWKTNWDNDLGTVPARPVTDNLIKFHRDQPSSRIIAHYMQPHFPSIPTQLGSGMDIDREALWNDNHTWGLIGDKITMDEAYSAYIENLRYVLDDVKLVLENIDADVVISADHGNAFGEWGETGHSSPYIGAIRNVPWIEVSATDEKTHTPKIENKENIMNNSTVDEKLRALGYKS